MSRATRWTRGICEARIKLAEGDTITKRNRLRDAQRRGHDPEQCGRRAFYAVDGVGLCLNHAGQAALKILMEKP